MVTYIRKGKSLGITYKILRKEKEEEKEKTEEEEKKKDGGFT